MNKEELKSLVAQMLRDMHGQPQEPMAKAAFTPSSAPVEDGTLPDITTVDLRTLSLVEHPHNASAFQALKAKTPARLAMGRTGTRYKTTTLLRFRADHAAAQDSVFSQVPEDFASANGMVPLQTRCKDKDEYLTRPDLGRRFDEHNEAVIRKVCQGHSVILVVGDGLSSAAITANAADCAAAITQGLKSYGISLGQTLFVKYCRVGASDHIGEMTGCDVVCMLVGERPGLVTSESMSAYLTYAPRLGIPESQRTVVSNIHRQGVSPVEAGAHIASLIDLMLKHRVSGVALAKELST